MFFWKKNKPQNETKAPLLLLHPSDSIIQGDIQSSHNIRIDGIVIGKIVSTSRVVISANAKVKGNIKCKEILVYGLVEGHILATESIELKGDARVNGNLISRKIQTDPGVTIDGKTRIMQDDIEAIAAGTF